jgi:AraC family transcriptional regulator
LPENPTGTLCDNVGIGLPKFKLRRVEEFIRLHLSEKIGLTELAAIARMSVPYFASSFKRSTGQTPHRYILNQRVELSKRLLSDPAVKIGDICLEVGFEQQNTFSRAFRRVTGISPRTYRRELEAKQSYELSQRLNC